MQWKACPVLCAHTLKSALTAEQSFARLAAPPPSPPSPSPSLTESGLAGELGGGGQLGRALNQTDNCKYLHQTGSFSRTKSAKALALLTIANILHLKYSQVLGGSEPTGLLSTPSRATELTRTLYFYHKYLGSGLGFYCV